MSTGTTCIARTGIIAFFLLTASNVTAQTTSTQPGDGACRTPVHVRDDDTCPWSAYVEPGSGLAVDYPASLLQPEPADAAATGRRFVSEDGAVMLSVWGVASGDGLNIQESMATDLYRSGFETVVRHEVEEDGYLIGGNHGARSFLKRVRRDPARSGNSATACITWPAERDVEWQSIAAKITGSLRYGGDKPHPSGKPEAAARTAGGYCSGL